MRSFGAMLAVALALPWIAFAQSPARVNLGTAGDFGILAKTGVSATGTTYITGDIGVSPAAATYITGFDLMLDPSGTFSRSILVNGKLYASDYTDPTPTKMTTAIGDMETAYNDAAGRLNPDYTELYAGDLTGQTLPPGLYKWGTGVLISAGGVTISGTATDIWILQIAGNLSLSSGANVVLGGSARPSNIFWQVAGQATLGTSAVLKGVVLCQTAIVMSTGATLDGRALAQTAVTLDANAVTAPVAVTAVTDRRLPEASALFQNYPNPFNPLTTIQYGLESGAQVSLRVYDVLGREVAILVNGPQEAGSYSVPFNTSKAALSLPSGVYIYRLEAGSFISVKKLVLVK